MLIEMLGLFGLNVFFFHRIFCVCRLCQFWQKKSFRTCFAKEIPRKSENGLPLFYHFSFSISCCKSNINLSHTKNTLLALSLNVTLIAFTVAALFCIQWQMERLKFLVCRGRKTTLRMFDILCSTRILLLNWICTRSESSAAKMLY